MICAAFVSSDSRLGDASDASGQRSLEKKMEPKEDAIVDIPKDRLGFFGGAGKMLLPGRATVAALIEKVPARKLINLRSNSTSAGRAPLRPKKPFRRLPRTPTTKLLTSGSSKRTEDPSLGFPAAQRGRRNA